MDPERKVAEPGEPLSNREAGLFTLIGLLLLLGAFMWWKSVPIFNTPQRFSIMFKDVGGLNQNAPVQINGMKVGAVESLELQGKDKVLVKVKINTESVRVPEGSKFNILTNGLVGAKYIEVTLPGNTDSQTAKLLNEKSVAPGKENLRSEIVLERLAKQLDTLDVDGTQSAIRRDMSRLANAAEDAALLSRKLYPAADRMHIVEDKIISMSASIHQTSGRVNKLLSNPQFAGDLKETALRAKEAATRVQLAIADISSTLEDEALRKDVVSALQELNGSTSNIEMAVQGLTKLGSDEVARADIKQIVSDARRTMTKVSDMVGKPGFGKEVRESLFQVKEAAARAEILAKQLTQILDKRAPLLQMMVGRPGRLKPEDKIPAGQVVQSEKTPVTYYTQRHK